ncbi:MAG: protein phosphatase 2C domain-containing protein [Gemmatimonadales bacterium]|nr:protein phosphatase 2C domain-containing protein [Gemmatimonadales bacterium]
MSEAGVELEVCARTDLGRTRDHNEDTFLVADLTRGTTDFLQDGRARVGPRGSLFLVADGMGGAAAGEIASAMAAEAIFDHLRKSWTTTGSDSSDEFTLRIREAVETANDRIHRYALEHPDSRGMGTTATVAGVFGNRLHLAQVGDSRAYLVRNGTAVQLTKDQSLMQRLIDAGELTEEQAAQSERRNIILQALGPDARIRVDVTFQDVTLGDTLILCSDGLSGQIKRDEIGALVNELGDVERICERLIAIANERGGPDNITAVVVRFGGDLPEAAAHHQFGYQPYPLPEPEPSGERPAVAAPPAPPELAEPDPVPAEAEIDPPPTRRSGSPVAVAAVGVLLLLVLLAIFLFFA